MDNQEANILKTQGEITGILTGISKRLDIANGRTTINERNIKDNTNDISDMKIEISKIVNKVVGAGIIVGFLIGIIGLFIK